MLKVAPATRIPRVNPGLAALYILWGAGVVFVFIGSRATSVRADLCPMHATTGLPCPFCGGTRAAFHLAALRPLDALAMNPLVAIALPLLALALALRFATARTITLDAPAPRRRAFTRGATLAAALLLLVNWAYLLARPPGAPF